MKFSLLVLSIVIGVTIAARYDNLDVDQILSNDRVLSSYIKCLLEKGPCTPEGRELRGKFILSFVLYFISVLQEYHFVAKRAKKLLS